jgi:valyl-tRNA synthetase
MPQHPIGLSISLAIIRILQHFATKLWNITNFVMLFQAMMNFFVYIKT